MKLASRTAALVLTSLGLMVTGTVPDFATTPVNPGQPAPPIELETVFQASPGEEANWAALKGKAVVLEFWATWCGACVMALPGLNELEEKLAAEPIRFIAITDENEVQVRRFLARRPIRGWVGIDRDRSMFEAYGAEALPQTVLVDGEGVVRAVTLPMFVNEAALRALIDGKTPDLPRNPSLFEEGDDPSASGRAKPLYEVSIRPTSTAVSWTRQDSAGFEAKGIPLRSLVSQAFEFMSTRILLEEGVPEFRYDVVVHPAGSRERVVPLLREAIESALQVEVLTRRVGASVYVLEKIPGAPPKLSTTGEGAQGWHSNPGEIEGVNMSAAALAGALEAALGRPVVDESHLRGKYDIRLKWNASQPDSLLARMEQELGLKLASGRRKLEFLVVRPLIPPGKSSGPAASPGSSGPS